MSAYLIYVAISILELGLIAAATDVMGGHGGRLGFGGVASACIGAYVYAIGSTGGNIAPAAAALCAVAIAASFGASVGWLATKWGADRYLLASFTIQVAIVEAANNLAVTGGPLGIRGIRSLAGANDDVQPVRAAVVLVIVAGTVLAFLSFLTSDKLSFGQWLHWTRDDEMSAGAAGVSPFRVRAIAGAVHGGAAAIAGVGIACTQGYVGPQSFDVWLSLKVVTVLVVAGLAARPHYIILASASLVALGELISFAITNPTYVGPIQIIVLNSVLIGFLVLRRRGIAGPFVAVGSSDAQY
jgi:ABC-type branched-subunit amino acid transport system permease subunit